MTIEYSRNGGEREPLAAFAELSKIMLGEGSLNETLGRIAALARDTIPDTDEVSVTLIDRDKPKTVVFTGQLAVHLDERQYESGLGPCLDAALTGETVVVEVANDNLYQDFAHSARGPASPIASRSGFPFRSGWLAHSISTPQLPIPWPRRPSASLRRSPAMPESQSPMLPSTTTPPNLPTRCEPPCDPGP
jgi:hypothetical protein